MSADILKVDDLLAGGQWRSPKLVIEAVIEPGKLKSAEGKTVDLPALKFADKAKELVSKLLTRDAHLRLGCLKGGAADIKSHAYFKNFDFKALVRVKLKAPWVPAVSDPLDCSNFEPYDEEDNSIEPYREANSKWDMEF